jgi:plasmid stabilization system protein ParE
MSSVVWTPTAVQDLQRHREFLAVLSPDVANRTIQSIVKQGESLIQNPRRGPVIEESSGLRKLPLRISKNGFVLHYAIILDEVVILRVYNGRENRPR